VYNFLKKGTKFRVCPALYAQETLIHIFIFLFFNDIIKSKDCGLKERIGKKVKGNCCTLAGEIASESLRGEKPRKYKESGHQS
jgi:hypothetical protein